MKTTQAAPSLVPQTEGKGPVVSRRSPVVRPVPVSTDGNVVQLLIDRIEGREQAPRGTAETGYGDLVEVARRPPIQRAISPGEALHTEPGQVAKLARLGTSGAGGPLPYMDLIQQSFGEHNVTGVVTHTDEKAEHAARELGATAFTIGNHVAFAGKPSLHTAAHEATHVIQQRGGVQLRGGIGQAGDQYEQHADLVADRVVAGESASVLLNKYSSPAASKPMANWAASAQSSVTEVTVQREEKSGQTTSVAIAQASRASLTDQYPFLLGILSEQQMSGLEAASELRYAKLRPPDEKSSPGDAAVKKLAKSVTKIPLNRLLSEQAQYVDVDSWDTIYSVLRVYGSPQLVGGLLRNEIMRRFIARNGLSAAASMVEISLVDPEGKVAGPSQLKFLLSGIVVPTTLGQITPADLKQALKSYSLDQAIASVTEDAKNVALAVTLVQEYDECKPEVAARVKRQATNPKQESPGKLRALASRLSADKSAAVNLKRGGGYVAPEAADLPSQFDALLKEINVSIAAQDKWLAEHHTPPSDAEVQEEVGSWLVGQGSKQWEKGGARKVLGGLAYTGAVVVSVIDGLENLLSFGYSHAEGEINKAYNRGLISADERDDLELAAIGRSVAVGIVTVAVTIATAGLGTEVAVGLGAVRGTFTYGAVVVGGGMVGGTLVSGSSLGTQALITGVGNFEDPSAQALWKSGMPSARDWKWGLATGAALGGVGALPRVLPVNAPLMRSQTPQTSLNVEGFDIQLSRELAVGTHADGRVLFVTTEGGGIYRPVPGGMFIPLKEVGAGGIPRSLIYVESGSSPFLPTGGKTLGPVNSPTVITGAGGGAAMVPYTGGAMGAGTSPLPISSGLPTVGGMLPGATGDQVIASFLSSKARGMPVTSDAVDMLMQDYASTLPPPPQVTVDFSSFKPGSAMQPFGLLPQGPQPFGLLPQGLQPFGLLNSPPPPLLEINLPGSYLPRVGTGVTPNFSSTNLGKNTMQWFGLPRSTSYKNWQPHHLIPLELKSEPVIQKIGMNLDHPTNCSMLPVPEAKYAGNLPIHEGYHSLYSQAVKRAIRAMDPNLPASVLEVKVFRLQQRLRAAIDAGMPLYKGQGATVESWNNIANGGVVP